MEFKFYGFKELGYIKTRRLRKIALKWLSDHLEHMPESRVEPTLLRLRKFKVNVMPTSLASKLYSDRFNRSGIPTSDNIPHEVMGLNRLDLFIPDMKSELMFASSIMTLSHGLGHVLLYCYDPHRRDVLDVDDASGNRRGDELSWHVTAVHNKTEAIEKTVQKTDDEELDNEIYYLKTYRFFPKMWKKVHYRVYDFRDDL